MDVLDGSVSMPPEYLYDFSCILRASLIIIVKNSGVLLRPPKFVPG